MIRRAGTKLQDLEKQLAKEQVQQQDSQITLVTVPRQSPTKAPSSSIPSTRTVVPDTDEEDETTTETLSSGEDGCTRGSETPSNEHARHLAIQQDLDIKLRLAKLCTEELKSDIIVLKKTLIENEVFGTQCSDSTAASISLDIDNHGPPPQLSDMRQFNVVKVPSLANEFHANPRRPIGLDMNRYLQNLSTLTGSNGDSLDSTSKRCLAEPHLLWLNANISRIVSQGAGSRQVTIPRLISSLDWAINSVIPRRLGQTALFMTVASITRRTGDITL